MQSALSTKLYHLNVIGCARTTAEKHLSLIIAELIGALNRAKQDMCPFPLGTLEGEDRHCKEPPAPKMC